MAIMSQPLRREVLNVFKSLHRARKSVFDGDVRALVSGREKINEEFRKNLHVSDKAVISELVNYARAVAHELKSSVIQAREVEPGSGIFEAKITKDTAKLDNVPYSDCGYKSENKS